LGLSRVRPLVKALHRELREPFNSWLNEDVYYIITPEGKETFFGLSTNEERDQFIEHFWYAAANVRIS
jgi:hypothetical protein